ncbi:lysozyme [Candidatus Rickettsia kedanie]|uniref:Lysozyme n=1 Tax=Candidatus Rickettsia kedanie TaxID=3115352 RepID=A0ABP9TSW9_9RICK
MIKQPAALISFISNCGAGSFQASTLRQKLNRGKYLNAATELPRWVHAKGSVKLQGLVKRRNLERSLFLSEAGTASIANEIVVT